MDAEVCEDPLPMLSVVMQVLGESEQQAEAEGTSSELDSIQQTIQFLAERMEALGRLADP